MLDAWKSLVKSQGWVLLDDAINQRLREHHARLSIPSEGMDGMVRKEFASGRSMEALQIQALPEEMISLLEEQYKEILVQREEEGVDEDEHI